MKCIQAIIFILTIFLISCDTQEKQDGWLRQIIEGDKILAFIYEENGKQGLLDTAENVLLKAQFDYIQDWQINGLVLVDSGGKKINGGDYIGYDYHKYGIINTSGQILFRPQFDDAIISDRTVMVLQDSLWGFIDHDGSWIKKPKYENALPYYKGTAVIKENGKFFPIDKRMKIINPTPFDTIWGFKNDISVVEKDKQYGFVNYRGQYILPLDNYRGIGDFNWYHGIFMKDDKWFVIDTTGRLPIKHGFDDISITNENGRFYAEGIEDGQKRKIELK